MKSNEPAQVAGTNTGHRPAGAGEPSRPRDSAPATPTPTGPSSSRSRPSAGPTTLPGGERDADKPGDARFTAATAQPTDKHDRPLERWGDFPVLVRARFQDTSGDDMPVAYRGWIDAYYRRLNARRSR